MRYVHCISLVEHEFTQKQQYKNLNSLSFSVTERAHFELRFETFNTFNHFEPNGLNVSKGNSQFGQITSAWDPRVMELGGKFIF